MLELSLRAPPRPCPDWLSARATPLRLGWGRAPSACGLEAGQQPRCLVGLGRRLKGLQNPGEGEGAQPQSPWGCGGNVCLWGFPHLPAGGAVPAWPPFSF